jgi:hypothetical protein
VRVSVPIENVFGIDRYKQISYLIQLHLLLLSIHRKFYESSDFRNLSQMAFNPITQLISHLQQTIYNEVDRILQSENVEMSLFERDVSRVFLVCFLFFYKD